MKKLADFEYKGKKVLVRVDFNVAFSEKGEILEDYRIKNTVPTIEYLIKKGAKIILMSHLGEGDPKTDSLKPVAEETSKIIGKKVKFIPDCVGSEVREEIEKMKEGEIVLLENVRFHKEEKENNENFAREIASFGDIFINDAFSVCHRKHASVVGIPRFLPSSAGLLLEKEIEILSKVLKEFTPPLVVVIGGVKIESKIKTIVNFLKIADHLLLGSKIGEAILVRKGVLPGREAVEEESIDKIDITSLKIHLPLDGVIALKDLSEEYCREGGIGTLKKEEEIFDIGPETIKVFKGIIKNAKTIFWSGPVGMFEDKRFEAGTKEIGDAIVRNFTAFKVAGGGDTVAAIDKFHFQTKFDFVSTGGGAMLEFLAGAELPGIRALES